MLRVVIAALAALLLLPHAEAARTSVPIETHQVRHSLRRGLGQRRARPHRRAGTGDGARPADRRGAQAQRRRHAGQHRGEALAARRLHAVVRHQQPAGRRAQHAEGAALNVLADFTPMSFLGENSFFIVVHPSVPAKIARRAHRRREGRSEAVELCRGQYLCPRGDRDVRDEERHRDRGDTLQVGARSHHRSAVRPRPGHERHRDLGRRRT